LVFLIPTLRDKNYLFLRAFLILYTDEEEEDEE